MAAPLSSWNRLNQVVSLHQPPSYNDCCPTFILATWMNASPRNIVFYVDNVRRLYPSARIFTIRGIPSNMVYRSERSQQRDLEPLVQALRNLHRDPNRGAVFLYAFSNSGAQQSGLLLRNYKQVSGGESLPVRGIILDSTPSRGSFSRAYSGLGYQLSSFPWYIRGPGLALLVVLILGVWLVGKIRGKPNVLDQSNRDLNNPSLILPEAERVYMYSKEDRLVTWDDVRGHAAMAATLGWEVKTEEFRESSHCKHGKGASEERYWGVLREMVNRGIEAQKLQSNL